MRREQLSTGLMDEGKSWVANGQERHCRFNAPTGRGLHNDLGGNSWKRNNRIFRVPDRVKITSASYCQLLESNLLPWLDDVFLQKRKTFAFHHDNAPAHSAKATQHILASLGISGKRLMVWPPCSSDLNAHWEPVGDSEAGHLQRWEAVHVKRKFVEINPGVANNLPGYEMKKKWLNHLISELWR